MSASDLPTGYRWATADETEAHCLTPNPLMIVVPRTADASGAPYTQGEADLAMPLTDAIYFGDNGRGMCRACAGYMARTTGRDLSGHKVEKANNDDALAFAAADLILACDCGKVTLTPTLEVTT